jgi:molybdenum cofactor cytidylyltransferase
LKYQICHLKFGAVVLAGGESRRFGRPKQLVPWDGKPLLAHVVDQVLAAALRIVIVVTGYEEEQVAKTVAGRPVVMVHNPHWAAGMSTSVRAGIQALPADVEAALFIMADQPNLTPGIIAALLRRYAETHAPIVVPLYGGQRGNPVLFARRMFAELQQVEGDRGGRDLIEKYRSLVEFVEVGPPEAALDIDTPEDYENTLSRDNMSAF